MVGLTKKQIWGIVCILGYLMKCGKKSSGKISKETKGKLVLTLWNAKDEKLRSEEKKKKL